MLTYMVGYNTAIQSLAVGEMKECAGVSVPGDSTMGKRSLSSIDLLFLKKYYSFVHRTFT